MSDAALIQYPLQLRACPAIVREAAAWFISGDSPDQWISEMTSWRVPLVAARVYPVPHSAVDNGLIGILVIVNQTPQNVTRALPYGRAGDALYLPADARLDPEPSSDELASHLRWDVQVLHPTAGLIGFSEQDFLDVAELLTAPVCKSADWSHALISPTLNDRLHAVHAEELPSIDQFILSGRDDIGTETNNDVPTSPDESPKTDAARAAFTKAALPFMSAFQKFLSLGKSGKMQQWANAKVKALRESLEAHRFRELQRLTDLMTRDPDHGLQFALPLRDLASRGISPPGGKLGLRSVDFNLSKILGGGQSGDSWNVPSDMRQTLQQQYRQAANRELNLGRHRRAAYIFAHLLGDFTSAAGVLKQGRHYREAAAIYLDQLKNKRTAAQCLMDGGLLSEAIPLYIELKMFELAGDLHERLGEHDHAVAAWQKELEQLRSRDDILTAAKLLETKLNNTDMALNWLESAWPNSDKAELCLAEWFNLASRIHAHHAALQRIALLRTQTLPAHRYLSLVRTLSKLANSNTDATVKIKAADATRVIAGNRLASQPETDRRQLVAAVVSLVPKDRLLDRDGQRFINREGLRPRVIAVKGLTPLIGARLQLPGGFTWENAVAIPGGFVALGASDGLDLLCVARGTWRGNINYQTVRTANAARFSYRLLPPSLTQPALIASIKGGPVLSGPLLIPRNDLFDEDLIVEQPNFLHRRFLGICRDEKGRVITLYDSGAGTATYALHDCDKTLSTHSIDFDLVTGNPAPVFVASRRGTVFIAHGHTLMMVKLGAAPISIALPAIARGMRPSPALTVTRMLVTFDDGGVIVRDNGEYRPFAQTLISPVATYLPDGSLVAVGNNTGQLYPSEAGKQLPPSSFETEIDPPLTILPAEHGEFAIFGTDGRVIVYKASAS